MHAVRSAVAVTCATAAVACAPAGAEAAIVITPGAGTVSTPRLELDFGDAGANVERLDSVRYRAGNGVLGANLATNNGAGGCDAPASALHWGEAGSALSAPQPVGSGSRGSWTLRGTRTVEINSSRPTSCTADTTVTPVRTRYTFFNVGDGAGRVRVERTFSFSASTPNYATATMRAYVPRLALGSFSEVVHPNATGSGLVNQASTNPATAAASWNGTWVAINNPATNAGLLIRRETTGSARLLLENDGTVNSSAADLLKPAAGWKAPVTETQWHCFYDATTWPPGTRATNVLPSGCSIVAVPINTALPAISGVPKVTGTVTTTDGTWGGGPSFARQWVSCAGGGCTAIPGATGASYAPVAADEGRQLRVDVTATAPGGEVDSVSSALTEAVVGGPPQSLTAPGVSGEARDDEILTGTTGTWSDAPTSFQYQWRRCSAASATSCADVAGATAATFKLTRNDVGANMRLRVVATNAAGASLAAESAPTGEIQPFLTRAFLAASPNPTCTGVATTLDAGASKSPTGAITRYRLSYKTLSADVVAVVSVFGTPSVLEQYLASLPATTLYDGTDPRPTFTFTWNRQLAKRDVLGGGRAGDYARDPLLVILTVTDKAGATATTSRAVYFAQSYSSGTRKDCPTVRGSLTPYQFATFSKVGFSKSGFAALIPCATRVDCAGSLSVFVVARKSRALAAKAKRVLIARNKLFTVAAGTRTTVRAKLTKAGLALAKRGKPIRARVQIASIDPATGKRTTRSKTVTIR